MTEYDPDVETALKDLPLARLVHFTPSRNLPHILRDEELRSVANMVADARACFTPTDLSRLDGHPDKISCSMQYPNGFYLAIAREKPASVNFPDWVCLLIDKHIAATAGALFSPCNAASGSATRIPGRDGLLACYGASVIGQRGRPFSRTERHDPGSPTDVQAEVLVPAPIPLSHVHGIVFPTAEAAEEEYGRLDRIGLVPTPFKWFVAPEMFRKWDVANAVRSSTYFAEVPWSPRGAQS